MNAIQRQTADATQREKLSATGRQTLRMILVLGLVSALSGLLLAAFYGWLNPIIERRKEQEVMELGMRVIFPTASTAVAMDTGDAVAGVTGPIYEVFDNQGNLLGLFYNVTGEGWSTFELAVGVDPVTQQVVGARVIEHQETPGVGSRITEDEFLSQFQGKSLADPFQTGLDIQGITGATVSVRGFSKTVSESARAVLESQGITITVAGPAASAGGAGAGGGATGGAAGAQASIPQPRHANDILRLAGEEAARLEANRLWEVRTDTGTLIGVAVTTEGRGFGGPVSVLTLIDPATDTVVAVDVLSHNETPGLGDEIEADYFLDQFSGKNTTDRFELWADVDGITMATESSTAVVQAIKQAIQAVNSLY